MKRVNGVDWNYFDKFEEVTDKYMLPRGEGDNMAMQAVTAVNKLVYKWYNDGDVYDNTFFMRGWCNDLSDYANWLAKNIDGCEEILDGLADVSGEGEYEELLQELADHVLNFKFLAQYESKEKVGSIYNCNGQFKFEEDYEDEEEDYWEDDEEEEDE